MQTSGSVFAEEIGQVKRTNYYLELLKVVDCFLDNCGSYGSSLVIFENLSSHAYHCFCLKRLGCSVNEITIAHMFNPRTKKNQQNNKSSDKQTTKT